MHANPLTGLRAHPHVHVAVTALGVLQVLHSVHKLDEFNLVADLRHTDTCRVLKRQQCRLVTLQSMYTGSFVRTTPGTIGSTQAQKGALSHPSHLEGAQQVCALGDVAKDSEAAVQQVGARRRQLILLEQEEHLYGA